MSDWGAGLNVRVSEIDAIDSDDDASESNLTNSSNNEFDWAGTGCEVSSQPHWQSVKLPFVSCWIPQQLAAFFSAQHDLTSLVDSPEQQQLPPDFSSTEHWHPRSAQPIVCSARLLNGCDATMAESRMYVES